MSNWQKTTVGKVATGFLSGGTPTTSTEMESTDNRPTIFANRLIPLAQTTESSCLHQIQNQQTEIGVYPVNWIVDRVDSAFDIQQGKQVSKRNRDSEHQRPFLRTKNVFWNRLELKGYLHDGTTLPLYYQLAPNDMLVPYETLDAEFLSLAEAEGVADIEELNKILDRAVNLKNFLKSRERIEKVAYFVAGHYLTNVEPLGYKAFLVGC